MREILFRGKRIDNGKWVEGYLRFIYVDNPKKASIYDSKTVRNYDVDYETVGQYTGLKDKNGVKIFEGDVVKHHIKNFEFTYVVEWESRLTKFVGKYAGDPYYGEKWAYAELHKSLIYEVIGNIHDNPELLEVQHENT